MGILSSLTYYSVSALLNLITSLVLILIVLIKNPRSSTNKIFALFMAMMGFWSLFYFLWVNVQNKELADFYLRTCMIGVIFMPSSFTHFVTSLLKQDVTSSFNNKLINKQLLIVNYLISVSLAATVYTPLFAREGNLYMDFSYLAIPGPIFHLHLLHFSLNFFMRSI